MLERSLAIVKPDAVKRGLTGRIIAAIEEGGLKLVRVEMIALTAERARGFYAVHRGKDFYDRLVSYMSSGPSVVCAVEADDAIRRLRALCGGTDPAAAFKGTIRAAYGIDITMNSVHASDSAASARYEIGFFFPDLA